MTIPKRIFMYWNGDIPKLPLACISRIKRLHPDWDVEILRDDNLCGEMPCLKFLAVQHRSDWARCCILARHGGVWLDSTCICNRPVTDWVDLNSDAIQGFSAPWDASILENWAFAVPTGSEFMREWKEEVAKACDVGHQAYCSAIPVDVTGDAMQKQLPYLEWSLLPQNAVSFPTRPWSWQTFVQGSVNFGPLS